MINTPTVSVYVDTYNLITNGMHNLFVGKNVCFRVNYGIDRAWVSMVGHAVKEQTHYLLLRVIHRTEIYIEGHRKHIWEHRVRGAGSQWTGNKLGTEGKVCKQWTVGQHVRGAYWLVPVYRLSGRVLTSPVLVKTFSFEFFILYVH